MARIFPRFRPFTRKQESRVRLHRLTFHPFDTGIAQVVPMRTLQDGELLTGAVLAINANPTKERGLTPKLFPLPPTQPSVDAFQMVNAVVTGDTFQVDAQEIPSAAASNVFERVLMVYVKHV